MLMRGGLKKFATLKLHIWAGDHWLVISTPAAVFLIAVVVGVLVFLSKVAG